MGGHKLVFEQMVSPWPEIIDDSLYRGKNMALQRRAGLMGGINEVRR